jgi:predicted nucleic acid-binding protein
MLAAGKGRIPGLLICAICIATIYDSVRTAAIIDTNVLVFDTFEDSEYHSEAISGLDAISTWYIPSIVFHELIWFFKAEKVQLSKANVKVEEYLTNEKSMFISCSADDVRFACSEMTNYKSYKDLIILSAARRLGVKLFAFDESLKKIASRKGVRIF